MDKKTDSTSGNTSELSDKLSKIRDSIDSIDDQMLELLSQRAACAEKVAETKRESGEKNLWFYRPEREAQILNRMSANNNGPLANERITAIYREVISSCLALEQSIKVAFLGPNGTFSQEASSKHFGHAVETVPMGSIKQVFTQVENGSVDYGVVPIENSTEGVISYTLDVFMHSPLKISGEVSLRIHQNLMTQNKNWQDVTIVYSHQQSLAQCRRWLDTNLPNAEQVPVSSNTEAARRAKEDSSSAAIAGVLAAETYALEIAQKNIEDNQDNTTRFLVIGKQDVPPSGVDKTTLMISAKNRSGALYHLLAPLAANGLDMTRIESRPSQNANWEYYFFMDIDGHAKDPKVSKALKELSLESQLIRVLGSYPKAIL
ncbi:MAG: chorismate mutase/prephenate dehydratase [Cocleimonas sp.]|jgi:chorismate mutase/prephenate dehydratase